MLSPETCRLPVDVALVFARVASEVDVICPNPVTDGEGVVVAVSHLLLTVQLLREVTTVCSTLPLLMGPARFYLRITWT